jgi:hypothetical protein
MNTFALVAVATVYPRSSQLWDARLGSRERGCQLEATAMNTLALIRAQILKAKRLHQAQLATVSNPRAQIF